MLDAVRYQTIDGVIHDHFTPELGTIPGKVRIIDQTLLPETLHYLVSDDLDEIADAIRRLAVRGAPAIGCCAALGLAAAATHFSHDFDRELKDAAELLASTRPTAVNLFWALERCVRHTAGTTSREKLSTLRREALDILSEDISLCRSIGTHGASLLKPGMTILTHCNAGALATADYGTALAPVYVAQERGIKVKVFSDETRPLLQGSRLTAWELARAGVDVTTICDNMAGVFLRDGVVDLVIVGADRIAANGDTANKIGTYSLAVLAHYHRVPFYVAAPYSTLDLSLSSGKLIPIEERNPEEIGSFFGRRTAPEGIKFRNPAFDVTPNDLITGFITERGIVQPPFHRS